MKKIYILPAVLLLIYSYLLLSQPEGVVVNKNGEIFGLTNIFREKVQGESFWSHQAEEVKSEIKWLEDEPNRNRKFEKDMESLQENIDTILVDVKLQKEEIYRDYPDLRPTAAEEEAERLREQAAELELQALKEKMESLRLKRLSELEELNNFFKRKHG